MVTNSLAPGWVRTEQANAYVAYITGTGLREYAATPGSDIEAAVFYPEDDGYLVDRETTVSQFEVAAAQAG